jgi:hypothetical protein
MGQVNRNWKLLEGGLPFHLLSWAREGLSASSPHRRPTSIFTWRQSDSDKSFTEKWIFISPVSSPAAPQQQFPHIKPLIDGKCSDVHYREERRRTLQRVVDLWWDSSD